MKRINLFICLTLILMPMAATAETAPRQLKQVRDEKLRVDKFNATAGEIEDMKVYSSTGDRVGEIEELLMDENNKITAAAVEIDELMKIDDDEVIVDLTKLHREENKIVASLTKEDLKKMPRWHD